ncbi:MAG: NUDIX hydrolase [Desulfitobacteriaceae bacterium]
MRKEHIEILKDVLPLVPGINGSEEYFKSAVLVLMVLLNDEYHLVFQKRALQIRQGGEICFPGGHYDPGIDPDFEHTALRETVEELGIAKEKLNIIGKLDTLVAPMGAIINPFVGIADLQSMAEITPDKKEVEYVFSVPVAYFQKNKPDEYQVYYKNYPSFIDKDGNEIITFPTRELGLPERYTKPWGDRSYKVYTYQVQGEIIWGSTARIIYDFIQRVNSI